MSEYTVKTGLSSILKNYSPDESKKIKLAAINKVRFEIPQKRGLLLVVQNVLNENNYSQYTEFLDFLSNGEITDNDFMRIILDGRKVIHSLKPEIFPKLIEVIMSLDWINRQENDLEYFKEFVVDILVAHNKYANIIIKKLISLWIPKDNANVEWKHGTPDKLNKERLDNVHDLIGRLLNVNPMLYRSLTDSIEVLFPYFKKPSHVVGGYIHNCLHNHHCLNTYQSDFTSFVIELIIKNLLKMDVNAPRNEIEDSEEEFNLQENIATEAMFQIDEIHNEDTNSETKMAHDIAEVYDVCIGKLFDFLKQSYNDSLDFSVKADKEKLNFSCVFKILLDTFEKIILPSHNTHHIQFLVFYCCSLKPNFADKFLVFLWSKLTNPNASAPIRQASIGYLASFLSRAKFISLSVIRKYLFDMSNWAHQYIERSDSVRSNISLRANLVFFAVCQAIFYIIAFRSRDLTKDKQSLLFLQSLQLPSLVTCTFNPLRVCLPAVATAFAGVTRTYQLAYCHTILERNARRKLATIYTNELMTPEECLETFFPFDPYLLKKSSIYINNIYLQYQANELEECNSDIIENTKIGRRKRGDSEMEGDDIDDFITTDKKFKNEISKSHEMTFTYGLSPGFHF